MSPLEPAWSQDPVARQLAHDREVERNRRALELQERERKRKLRDGLEAVRAFQGPEDMTKFATAWAPRWTQACQVLREQTTFQPAHLSLPLKPENELALRLLGLAFEGAPVEELESRLRETLLLLKEDDRIWAMRRIWEYVEAAVGLAAPVQPTEESTEIPELPDYAVLILRTLAKQPDRRLTTSGIAHACRWNPKAIGKHLVALKNLGLIENQPRKGYLLTWRGRRISDHLSSISPKQLA